MFGDQTKAQMFKGGLRLTRFKFTPILYLAHMKLCNIVLNMN